MHVYAPSAYPEARSNRSKSTPRHNCLRSLTRDDVATQVPYVVSGNYVYVTGQIPVLDDEIDKCTFPKDMSRDVVYQSSRLCGLDIIAQARSCEENEVDGSKQ